MEEVMDPPSGLLKQGFGEEFEVRSPPNKTQYGVQCLLML